MSLGCDTRIREKRKDREVLRQGVKEPSGEAATPASIADRVECMPRALTVRELMTMLQVSDQTIYRMIADQAIPFFLVRGSYRFDPKRIAEWLRKAPCMRDYEPTLQ